MEKLISELKRLYFLPGQQWPAPETNDHDHLADGAECGLAGEAFGLSPFGEMGAALELLSPEGKVRAMTVDFDRAADWGLAAILFQALQEVLDLPAPAVSVSGQKGFRFWLSLAEPVPCAQARDFLDALRRNYLTEIPVADLGLLPDDNRESPVASVRIMLTPACQPATGKWSAFIDPSLVAMFVDEPWLEMAPNMERQAEMLAGLKSMEPKAFQRALDRLQGMVKSDPDQTLDGLSPLRSGESDGLSSFAVTSPASRLSVGSTFTDPVSFLLAVMNDSSADAAQRIDAAKALLPYLAQVRNDG